MTVTASAIHQARPPTREPSSSSIDLQGQGQGTRQSPTALLSGLRPRVERSPSAPVVSQVYAQPVMHTAAAFPKELLPLLDGEHHTDELCTRFEVGFHPHSTNGIRPLVSVGYVCVSLVTQICPLKCSCHGIE